MAVSNVMNDKYISPADAKTTEADQKAAAARGNPTTARGTRIVTSTGEVSKDSFLKILVAEMSNLDPTSNQDSTAQVTQMAQLTAMEQTQNLNKTMSDYAYNQMVGKQVILNQRDENNAYVKGYVNGVIKMFGSTYFDMVIDGEAQDIKAENVIGVYGSDINTISNDRAALNSDFLAASSLASSKQSVVLSDVDADKKAILVKGKVTGAYIDTVSNSVVKVKVDLVDDDGNSTGNSKVYDYSNIVRAGDLTKDDMNLKLTSTTGTIGTTTNGTSKGSESIGKTENKNTWYSYPATNTTATNTSNDSTASTSTATNTTGTSA